MPGYHGWHMALWIVVPALVGWAIWSIDLRRHLVQRRCLPIRSPRSFRRWTMDRAAILAEARTLARRSWRRCLQSAGARSWRGRLRAALRRFRLIGARAGLLVAFAGGGFGFTRIRAGFPARTRIERAVMLGLLLASLLAILTTVGIVVSLLFESARSSGRSRRIDFLTGLHWAPQCRRRRARSDFGAVPLFWGTIYIGAIIAMIVAIPLGLMSAIYLTQYASARARRWLKPMLEILAGIPTVVYGYFAALTVAPMVRDFAGALGKANPSTESALAAGLVMGVMIIPFVSSMADDSIAAVPQAMRDGSLAMGATQSRDDQEGAAARRAARHRRRA